MPLPPHRIQQPRDFKQTALSLKDQARRRNQAPAAVDGRELAEEVRLTRQELRQLEGHLASLESLIATKGKEAGAALHERLSGREREVLALIGQGQAVKQIAATLGICEKTVWTMRQRVLKKLGLRTSADLVRYAVKHGLVE